MGAASSNGTGVVFTVNFTGFPSESEYGPFGKLKSFFYSFCLLTMLLLSVSHPRHACLSRRELHRYDGPSRSYQQRRIPPLWKRSARDMPSWWLGWKAWKHHWRQLLCQVSLPPLINARVWWKIETVTLISTSPPPLALHISLATSPSSSTAWIPLVWLAPTSRWCLLPPVLARCLRRLLRSSQVLLLGWKQSLMELLGVSCSSLHFCCRCLDAVIIL